MRVDPSGGVSPAEGTKVRTQAEYDSLGHDLKYIQDAFDILPAFLSFPVRVDVAPGLHLAKPLTGLRATFYSAAPIIIPAIYMTNRYRRDEHDTSIFRKHVTISGEGVNEVDAEQSGVITKPSLTRDAGTWVVDSLKGYILEIMTGASAGTKAIIESNTDTTLTVVGVTGILGTNGACTFRVVDPSSIVSSSYDGVAFGTQGTMSQVGAFSTNVIVQFENLKFGDETYRYGYGNALGPVRFSFCRFRIAPGNIFGYFGGDIDGLEGLIEVCDIFCEGAVGSSVLNVGGKKAFLSHSYVRGSWRANSYLLSISVGVADGYGRVLNSTFAVETGFNGSMFNTSQQCLFGYSGIKILGNSGANCYGVSLANGVRTAGFGGILFDFRNCGVGITVKHSASPFQLGNVIGTGNTYGAMLNYGTTMLATSDPSGLAATYPIQIDGVNFNWTDCAAFGDIIEGRYGSRYIREY
jgi:hypothetical protein